jgi:hypothetical protein
MSMIFPGMDPYLENPQLWPGVHNALVVYLRDQLQPMLRPRYIAAVEDRVFVEGPDRDVMPDVWVRRSRDAGHGGGTAVAVAEPDDALMVQLPGLEIHESYIQILDLHSGQRVVTVIEVVSPSNKYAGPGRESYLAKQREVRGSAVHLVEIDLLRAGQHVVSVPEWAAKGKGPYDYLVCTNRGTGVRDLFELYPRRLRDRLPRIAIPLAGDDAPVTLDVQAGVAQVYEAGAYRDRINYQSPCQPPLAAEDQPWAADLLRTAYGAIK